MTRDVERRDSPKSRVIKEKRKPSVKKEEVKQIIEKLLAEIEEEDIGISLFSTCYQDAEDLRFFKDPDRERLLAILKKISDDSRRHKNILERIVTLLGKKICEN